VYRTQEFFNNLRERKHFLTRVMDEPRIPVIGSGDELRRMAKEWVAEGTPKQRRGNNKSPRNR
jgi:hypothetical protein